MAGIDAPVLPTDFAIALLENAEFLDTEAFIRTTKKQEQLNNERFRRLKLVAQFQRMAICTTFDKAMIAFYGIEIDSAQNDVLKVIYDSTIPWMKGLVVDACLQALTHKYLNKSEFEAAVKAITEQTSQKAPDQTGKRMQGIIVKVTQSQS